MPFDGAGNYGLPTGTLGVSGAVIDSTKYNAFLADLITALSGSVRRNGESALSANLPMGGNRITGIGDAVSAQDAVSKTQLDLKLTASLVSAFALTLLDDADAAAMRTTLVIPDSLPRAGMRNLIINGNFAVNQRAYVSGTNTTGANQYTLDRWYVITSGQNITFTTSGNGRLVTAPAGGLGHVIIGASVAGGTYVINWTGTATCTVDGAAKSKGATFTLTANTNATVIFSSGTVGEVQIEPGTVVTAFEPRPYELEKALCQATYRKSGVVAAGTAVTSTQASLFFPFSPEMSGTPTMSVLSSSPDLQVGGSTSTIAGTWTLVTATPKGALVSFARTAGTWTAGTAVFLNGGTEPLAFTV
jgi:hypothetical protein